MVIVTVRFTNVYVEILFNSCRLFYVTKINVRKNLHSEVHVFWTPTRTFVRTKSQLKLRLIKTDSIRGWCWNCHHCWGAVSVPALEPPVKVNLFYFFLGLENWLTPPPVWSRETVDLLSEPLLVDWLPRIKHVDVIWWTCLELATYNVWCHNINQVIPVQWWNKNHFLVSYGQCFQ